MEQNKKIMKHIIFLFSLLIGFSPLSVKGIDFAAPKDIPTIEALIALHKEMKKNEDAALTQVTTVTAQQDLTTDITSRISNIKQIINTKMNTVNTYLILATTITNTTMKMQSLINEYENFMSQCTPIIKEKPFVSVKYANTQKMIAEETKRLYKSIAAFSASGVNLLKASMDEKFKLIYLIDDSVSRMRNVISKNRNYILYTAGRNLWTADVRDIITDNMLQEISDKLIQQWNNQLK